MRINLQLHLTSRYCRHHWRIVIFDWPLFSLSFTYLRHIQIVISLMWKKSFMIIPLDTSTWIISFPNWIHVQLKKSRQSKFIKKGVWVTCSLFYSYTNISLNQWITQFLIHRILGTWPNTYTLTKALAEDLIRKECERMPVGVFRPAIVTSTWKEPVKGWIDNLYGPTGVGMLMQFISNICNN